jgi:hypothetical protein
MFDWGLPEQFHGSELDAHLRLPLQQVKENRHRGGRRSEKKQR